MCFFVDALNPSVMLSCRSSRQGVSCGLGSDRSMAWDINKGCVSLSTNCDKITLDLVIFESITVTTEFNRIIMTITYHDVLTL